MRMKQTAIRLPQELLQKVDAMILRRKADHADNGNWNAARQENRSNLIREAVELGLKILQKQDRNTHG